MADRKIFMACSNYWTSPFQLGNNHLARAFIREGWKVAWISDPVTPLHILGGRIGDYVDRYRIYRRGGGIDLDGNLWYYVPGALMSPNNWPLLRSAWVHRNWYQVTMPRLIGVVGEKDFLEVDLLWINSTAHGFWLDKIQYKQSILRIADNSTGFSRFTSQMASAEREMAKKVDLVVYTAHSLKDYVEDLNPKATLFLPNGVDFKHFQNGDENMPADFNDIHAPIVIYVGAMEEWFDFELVKYAAKNLPTVSFVLIGPDYLSKARKHFATIENVYLLGRKQYQEIPSYLRNANVGIIPFDVANHSNLVNSINPIKLFEYFASGLQVVSVEWEELINLGSPAKLCKTRDEFVEAIISVLGNPPPKENLIDYARGQDWYQRFRLLKSKIII
jgi:hypothetical protein